MSERCETCRAPVVREGDRTQFDSSQYHMDAVKKLSEISALRGEVADLEAKRKALWYKLVDSLQENGYRMGEAQIMADVTMDTASDTQTDEKGRPMTYWGGKSTAADGQTVWPEGATPCTSCSEPAVIKMDGMLHCLCCGDTADDRRENQ